MPTYILTSHQKEIQSFRGALAKKPTNQKTERPGKKTRSQEPTPCLHSTSSFSFVLHSCLHPSWRPISQVLNLREPLSCSFMKKKSHFIAQ
ncbi:rCG54653 [Rattus norvegicus]|uniref:RCG54653 n=1 Tax=Rattus norvegicus TaxID=10116 RepID=A6JA08_RAT|nr:rCG54653 [Rattus norvegicus]